MSRFFKGGGRYSSFKSSRYMDFTYGPKSFIEQKDTDANHQAHGTYGALLFDRRWIDKRNEIITRDMGACVICKGADNLQVHHRQYHYVKALQQFKAPWDYENFLMVTLCERCHSRGHSKFRIPNVYL